MFTQIFLETTKRPMKNLKQIFYCFHHIFNGGVLCANWIKYSHVTSWLYRFHNGKLQLSHNIKNPHWNENDDIQAFRLEACGKSRYSVILIPYLDQVNEED